MNGPSPNEAIGVHPPFQMELHHTVDRNLMIKRKNARSPDSLFVSVEVLWPSQPNGVMWSAVSLPNYTFTGQA